MCLILSRLLGQIALTHVGPCLTFLALLIPVVQVAHARLVILVLTEIFVTIRHILCVLVVSRLSHLILSVTALFVLLLFLLLLKVNLWDVLFRIILKFETFITHSIVVNGSGPFISFGVLARLDDPLFVLLCT